MTEFKNSLDNFARDMRDLELIRFGDFTLKSGLKSPFYLDLRQLLKDPEKLDRAAELLADKARDLEFDVIAGIPYTAVPLAALISVKLGRPLIIPRKEEKTYGTGGNIMGNFREGDRCLVLDDLITTGASKLETAEKLEREGLAVKDFLVLIDRRPAGEDELEARGYRLRSLFSLPELLASLENQKLLPREKGEEIRTWLEGSAAPEKANTDDEKNGGPAAGEPAAGPAGAPAPAPVPKPHPLTARLLSVMEEKQSNLILSLDVTRQEDFFRILKDTAGSIAALKTHVDILEDFEPSFIEKLTALAAEKNFLLFEDRKFADIGNTVRHQYRNGIYKIHDWADFVTVHLIAGPGTLEGLFDGTENKGGFLLARMSSKENLINPEYTQKVIEIGARRPEWVCGYIGHGRDPGDIRQFKSRIPQGQLLLMPGVQLESGGDGLGQQYLGLEDAVEGGADLLIVGRGLYRSDSPGETAEVYRRRGWDALERRRQKETK